MKQRDVGISILVENCWNPVSFLKDRAMLVTRHQKNV